MGVMRQAHEVGIDLVKHAEDILHIFVGMGASASKRSLRMGVGALEKDRRTVQQDACAINAYVAEPDIIRECVTTRAKLNLI